MKKYTAEVVLIIITLIWGATFAIIKLALNDISTTLFVVIRFSVSAIILLPFIKTISKHWNKETIAGGVILGILYFLGFYAQTLGLNYTSATKSGFLTGTFVVITPFFQLLIQKRKPGKGTFIGVLLVLFGLILLSSNGNSLGNIFNEIGSNFNIGDLLTLICAVCFALYLVYIDIISKKHEYLPLVFIQILLTAAAGLILLPILSFSGAETVKFNLNSEIIFTILYTSILATVAASLLQTKYQKFLTPAQAGIILSFEPIFAAVFAFFLLDEKISNFGLLGCLFIFSGLVASEVIDQKKKEK
jgi:drug/metabolite transporter (DMT)-like permease